jgi:hypothetical protein
VTVQYITLASSRIASSNGRWHCIGYLSEDTRTFYDRFWSHFSSARRAGLGGFRRRQMCFVSLHRVALADPSVRPQYLPIKHQLTYVLIALMSPWYHPCHCCRCGQPINHNRHHRHQTALANIMRPRLQII